MKELGRVSTGQKAETAFFLEIVDAVAQDWEREVNKTLSEFMRNEVNNPVDSEKHLC